MLDIHTKSVLGAQTLCLNLVYRDQLGVYAQGLDVLFYHSFLAQVLLVIGEGVRRRKEGRKEEEEEEGLGGRKEEESCS